MCEWLFFGVSVLWVCVWVSLVYECFMCPKLFVCLIIIVFIIKKRATHTFLYECFMGGCVSECGWCMSALCVQSCLSV